MTVRQNRLFVAFKIEKSVPLLIRDAQAIVAAMTGNRFFPAPKPALAVISAAIAKLVAAETKTKTTRGDAVPKRNEARRALARLLRALQVHVEFVANADAEHAAAIITSAGMQIRKPDSRRKPPFAVKPGRVSGSVILVVRAAGGRAAYFWAWSADDGKSWNQVASTTRADTVITGLPVGKRCSFRYRTVTKAGESDWSEAISLIVD